MLLGRATYDYWVGYWPSADVEPFASFINGVTKHVASSQPLDPPGPTRRSSTVPVVKYVQALKRRPGGTIGIHGSTTLGRSLLDAGLVDEIRLAIAPTLAGAGHKLFDGLAGHNPRRRELVEISPSAQGTLFAHYRLDSGRRPSA